MLHLTNNLEVLHSIRDGTINNEEEFLSQPPDRLRAVRRNAWGRQHRNEVDESMQRRGLK